MAALPVSTPCVKVCVGCLRTLPEIAGWGRLNEAERERIMAELPARRGRVDPAKLG